MNKAIFFFLANLLLAGSFLLPLGDFSLLRDMPRMYDNYTRITTPDELGVIDFIGDYLLNGKELFGNNKHDKCPAHDNDVQFQHEANPLIIALFSRGKLIFPPIKKSNGKHYLFNHNFLALSYSCPIFKPPAA